MEPEDLVQLSMLVFHLPISLEVMCYKLEVKDTFIPGASPPAMGDKLKVAQREGMCPLNISGK